MPKVVVAYETNRRKFDILERRTKNIMTLQLLSLVSHPTIIASTGSAGGFEGWGVRIGA